MKLLSSVNKALTVLDTFSDDKPEMSLTEISILLDTHKSSISRILTTLASSGYVEKNPSTNKYRLGLKVLDLANRILNRYDLKDHAGPYMEELARKTGEIIHLSVLDGNDIVYLDKKGRSQILTVATRVGGRNPAHASAMGKILLSGLTEKELTSMLNSENLIQFTPNTITDMHELLKEIEQVKKQGYALDDEESFAGIRCAAAPLYGRDGKIIAAISVSVPKQRMGKKRMEEIRMQVVETARLISERITMNGLEE